MFYLLQFIKNNQELIIIGISKKERTTKHKIYRDSK